MIYTCFLLLIVILFPDAQEDTLLVLFSRTLILHVIFLFLTHCKAMFSLLLLFLLVVDQLITLRKFDTEVQTYIIRPFTGILLIVGFVSYAIRQKQEFKSRFSLLLLFFGFKCTH